MANLSGAGSAREGYTTSMKELLDVINMFEYTTNTKYICKKRDQGFELDTIEHSSLKQNPFLRWKDTQSNIRPKIETSGVPFVILGKGMWACRPASKENSTTEIRLRKILCFPTFKVAPDASEGTKYIAEEQIKHSLANMANLKSEVRFYYSLPDVPPEPPGLHTGHTGSQVEHIDRNINNTASHTHVNVSHQNPTGFYTNPIFSHPNPTGSHTNPLISHPNPTGSHTHPIVSHPNPTGSHTNPIVSHPNPTGSHTGFSYAHIDHMNSHMELIARNAIASYTNHIGSHPNPIISHPNPIGSHPNSIGSHPNLIGSHPNPIGSHTNTIGSHTNPIGSHINPVGSHINHAEAYLNLAGSYASPVGSHTMHTGHHTTHTGAQTNYPGPHTNQTRWSYPSQIGSHPSHTDSHTTQTSSYQSQTSSHPIQTNFHTDPSSFHTEPTGSHKHIAASDTTTADSQTNHTNASAKQTTSVANQIGPKSKKTRAAKSTSGSKKQTRSSKRKANSSTNQSKPETIRPDPPNDHTESSTDVTKPEDESKAEPTVFEVDWSKPFAGFVDSHASMLDLVHDFENSTNTRYIFKWREADFKLEMEDVLKPSALKKHFVRWKDKNSELNPHIDTGGIPFIILGRGIWKCHQGRDSDKLRKAKRRQKYQESRDYKARPTHTKKVDCRSEIRVRKILCFPSFKLKKAKRTSKDAQVKASQQIKTLLMNEDEVKVEMRYYYSLPKSHSNHKVGEAAGSLLPMDNRIKTFIGDMVSQCNVKNAREMRSLIEHFVTHELFKGKEIPPRTQRNFWPRLRDIHNHISLSMKRQNRKDDASNAENLSTTQQIMDLLTDVVKTPRLSLYVPARPGPTSKKDAGNSDVDDSHMDDGGDDNEESPANQSIFYPTGWDKPYSGYEECFDSLMEIIHGFESATNAKFLWKKRETGFKLGKTEVLQMKLTKHLVRWKDTRDDTNPHIDTGGIPFIILGKGVWKCHQGKDFDKNRKEKRKQYYQVKSDRKKRAQYTTKKVGCKSEVLVRKILCFPTFKLKLRAKAKDAKQNAASQKIKTALLKEEDLTCEIRYCYSLPKSHTNHDVGEASKIKLPMDIRIKHFIHDMVTQFDVRKAKDMQPLLERYLTNELFKGQELPPRTQRKFWPTLKDISNHIHLSLKKTRGTTSQETAMYVSTEEGRLSATGTNESEPTTVDHRPTTSEHQPKLSERGPAISQGVPTTSQSGPTTIQSEPPALERGPSALERLPTTLERGPTTLERGPTTLERGPATLERGPTTLERGPTTLERGPTILERGPTISKSGPTTSEHRHFVSEIRTTACEPQPTTREHVTTAREIATTACERELTAYERAAASFGYASATYDGGPTTFSSSTACFARGTAINDFGSPAFDRRNIYEPTSYVSGNMPFDRGAIKPATYEGGNVRNEHIGTTADGYAAFSYKHVI